MTTPTVAVYTRISQDKDGREEGVELQEKKARDLAAREWPDLPVEVFCDNDISAADHEKLRPEYDRMLDEIRLGNVVQIVTMSQSRLQRDNYGLQVLAIVLQRAGIEYVHTLHSGPVQIGGLMSTILGAVDAEYVKTIRINIDNKLAELAVQGRPSGGRTFGYLNVIDFEGRKALEIIPEQADVIRWAAGRILAGWSMGSVVKDLQARNVPTARGGKWQTTTVRQMLCNPTVAGHRVHRREIVGRGNWEPILDDAVWRQVGAILHAPLVVRASNGGTKPVNRTRQTGRRYLLTSGLAVCGQCDTPLVATQRVRKAGVPRPPHYTCPQSPASCGRNSIDADALEAHVVSEFFALLESPEFLAGLTDVDVTAERDALLVKINDEVMRRRQLAKRYAMDEIDSITWDEIVAVLNVERDRLAAEMAALPVPTDAALDFDSIREGWEGMILDEKRLALRQIIQAVIVDPPPVAHARGFNPARVRIV